MNWIADIHNKGYMRNDRLNNFFLILGNDFKILDVYN